MLAIPPAHPLSQFYEALKPPLSYFPSNSPSNYLHHGPTSSSPYPISTQYGESPVQSQYPPSSSADIVTTSPIPSIPSNTPNITPNIPAFTPSPNPTALPPSLPIQNQPLASNPPTFTPPTIQSQPINQYSSSLNQYQQANTYIPPQQPPQNPVQPTAPACQYSPSQQLYPKVSYPPGLSLPSIDLRNRPPGNRNPWSIDEDEILSQMYEKIGPQWATIAELLPGRSIPQIRSRRNAIESRKRQRQKSALKHLRLAHEFQMKQQLFNETIKSMRNCQNPSTIPPSNPNPSYPEICPNSTFVLPVRQDLSQPSPVEAPQAKKEFYFSINSLLN